MTNLYIQPYQDGRSAVDRELGEKRRRLLVQLNSFDNGHESVNPELTRDLKRRYNEVVNEQWDRRRGSFLDPLVAVPPDVWSSILARVVEEHTYSSLFTLLHVSQAWTCKIISCPTLWTKVVVDPNEEDLLAKMPIFLHLSQKSSIGIHLIPQKSDALPDEVYQLLIPHKDRIGSISHGAPSGIVWIRQKLGYLPNLQRILLPDNASTPALPPILALVPSVRQFDGEIRGLSAEAVLESCLSLPNSVSFRMRLPAWQSPSHGDSETQLIFRQLRHLQLAGNQSVCFDLLSCLHSPLTSLSVQGCYQNTFHILVEIAARFPRLERLDVSILPRDIKLSQQVHPNLAPPTLSIWSLRLAIVLSGRGPGHDIEEEVLGIVRACMPFIKHLDLGNIEINPMILSMIQSLSQIQALEIWHTSGSYPAQSPSASLPKLRQLRWAYDSRLRCLSHLLQTPNLTSYEFVFHFFLPPNEVSVVPQADLLPRECGSSLTRLVIRSVQPTSLSLRDLPALRELDIGDNTPGYWASDLLEQLIILPKACPRLFKIVLGIYYVDWDTLFLVLERRNFLDDPKVSLIREVHLDVIPSRGYLQAFTGMLGGRFQLSPRGTCLIDKFDDMPHLTRNQICYNCGTSLKEPINVGFMLSWDSIMSFWGRQIISDWTYSTPSLDEKPDPPLQESLRFWLAGKWDRRRREMKLINESMGKNVEFTYCRACRSIPFKPIILTAHSPSLTMIEG